MVCLTDSRRAPGGHFVSIRGVSASEHAARDDVTQASFINSDTNLDNWVRLFRSHLRQAHRCVVNYLRRYQRSCLRRKC